MTNQFFVGKSGPAATPVYNIYATNGTAGPGTVALPASFTTSPSSLTESGAKLYFIASDSTGADQIWDTDGTTVTRLDPNPNAASDSYTNAHSITPFTTAAGVNSVAFIANAGTAATPSYQLFVTNGSTGAGTQAITSGGAAFGTLPSQLTVSGSKVYFTAMDSSGATEVWATDGTTVTKLDPNPAAASDTYTNSFSLTPFTTASGVATLAFVGNAGTALHPNYQLFVTNGTAGAGTHAITSGGASFGTMPSNLTVSGSKVFFTATDSTGNTNVWATDGTSVARLDPTPAAASASYIDASNLTAFPTASGGAAVAFTANLGTLATPVYQLIVSNGTAGTGTKVLTSGGGIHGTNPGSLTVSGAKLFYTAVDASGGMQAYATDGATTARLDPAPSAASDSYIQTFDLTAFTTASGAASVAFVANAGTAATPNYQLFVSDGTAGAGTKAITTGGATFGTLPSSLTVSGSKLFFTAQDGAGHYQVWATDGTTVTRLDPNPSGASDSYISAFYLTPFTNAAGAASIAFVANAGTAATPSYQLYISNGTAGAGTQALTSGGAAFGTLPSQLTANGSSIYFSATDSSGKTEAWVATGNTVTKLDPNPAAASDSYTNAFIPALNTYALAALDATKADAAAGTTPYTFTVTRAGNDTQPATIGYAATGSGANPAPASLFANAAGTVSFAAGQSTATITLDVNGAKITADEAFTLSLTPTTGPTGVPATSFTAPTATGLIQANSNGGGGGGDTNTNPFVGYVDSTTGVSAAVHLDAAGAGGPGYLQWQYIVSGPDNLAISTEAPNVFLHSGSGEDALQVKSGQNVLDGGLGSNFLTGGSGNDTFFTDSRAPGAVWNTIRNFHGGDAATLWGFTSGVSSYYWETDLKGAAGAEGATLRANIVGGNGRIGDGVDASITFTGMSVAQARGLQIVTGTQTAGNYLYIYNPGV